MSRKRRLPAGKLGSVAPPAPYALENEHLALILGPSQGDGEAQVRRVRQRHPTLTEEEATALVQRCLQAEEAGFAIVASAMAQGKSTAHASGQILHAYPWMSLRNVEEICWRGMILAK